MGTLSQATRERLLQWGIFGVLFSLAPLGFRWMWAGTSGDSATAFSVLSQGELLLIASALASAAVVDLFPVHPRLRMQAIAVAGLCLLVVILSSSYYAAVTIAGAKRSAYVVTFSVLFFLLSLVGGAASIISADRAKGRR